MRLINTISVVVPVAVALLLGIRTKIDLGAWTSFLPHVIGGINTLTTVILIAAWLAIRKHNIQLHGRLMISAICLGALFLVCYVTYHVSNAATPYGGTGFWRILYYFVLISHIAMSLVVLPLVLRTFAFAITGRFRRHRSLAKFAFPIWLYVSSTGVLVYLMISPYYSK
jgi:putative membrane protein